MCVILLLTLLLTLSHIANPKEISSAKLVLFQCNKLDRNIRENLGSIPGKNEIKRRGELYTRYISMKGKEFQESRVGRTMEETVPATRQGKS